MKSRFFTIVKPLMFLFVLSLMCWLPGTAMSGRYYAGDTYHETENYSNETEGYSSDELTQRIKTGAYLQKIDNIMIIMDGLGEHDFTERETPQVRLGKALIHNIGATIPKIPHRRMLRVYGPTADTFQEDFSTIFGLYHIDGKGFTPLITSKTHAISDIDPLDLTFFSAIKDLRKVNGPTAIVLISRGDQISKNAVAESAYLKKALGGSVCFYPIFIGKKPKDAARMQQIQRIGGCGIYSTYADVDTPEEMTDFVQTVFFAKKRNFTPEKEELVVEETKPDENITEVIEEPYEPEVIGDVDEVVEDSDVIIIERQLPHDKVVTIELHVEFDLNKSTIKDEFKADIQNIADFMIKYPETEVLLEGHTCSLGTDAYNLDLSLRRAAAVQNCLINNFGIGAERIKIRGAGEAEPMADNGTEEGRIRNRRVMAVISTIITDYTIIEQEISKEQFLSDDFVLPPIEEVIIE